MFHVFDSRIAEPEIIHEPLHCLSQAAFIRFFIKKGRTDDQGLFMFEQRYSTSHLALPAFGLKRKREPVAKNTLDPSLQDRRKPDEPYRGNDDQCLRLRYFPLLFQNVPWLEWSDKFYDIRSALITEPSFREKPDEPVRGSLDHPLQIFHRRGFINPARIVP